MCCRTLALPLVLLLLLAGWTAPSVGAQEGETRHVDAMEREYYLYAPKIDPAKEYWLVVGVHGAGGNGKGAGGFPDFINNGHCIVVGPSFPAGYQGLQNGSDQQLVALFAHLKKSYKLHDRMFLVGFSGGAQFVHRFALKHPELTIGCAAHGGGSWATGDFSGENNLLTDALAAKIPIAVSCGANDKDKSTPTSPLSRIDWAKKFADGLKEKRFLHRAEYYPKVGHQMTVGTRTLTDECFAISVTGMTKSARAELEKWLTPIRQSVAIQDYKTAAAKLATLDANFAKARAKMTPKKDAPFQPGWSAGETIRDELEARANAYVTERGNELRRLVPGLRQRQEEKRGE